jgi:3'(2'), 5'-bisphosphate nucleotidase
MTQIDIERIVTAAIEAGKAIMDVYTKPDFETEMKEGNFPLTLADRRSHELIYSALSEMYPEIPVLSEEGKNIPYEERKSWQRFWLVDPLDGTKEFIKRNGEFTVNIALIENNLPVMGIIYVPVTETLYFAGKGIGSFKKEPSRDIEKIRTRNVNGNGLTAVKSRSHSSDDEENIMKDYNITGNLSIGSSLKFCMIAEGKADIYYRHGPTMEWDTAAGQAIVEEAGGMVIEMISGNRFTYNKEDLRNSSFLVKRNEY